jgi:ABC-type anion transport system duplicated permease subunit
VPPKARPNSGDHEGNGLVPRVRAKRAEVERYLLVVGVRRRRLVTVTIFAAAISTLLTALAALWGQQLARLFADIFGTATDGWRMLCALAAACSLTAGVATQLQTSKNYEERIAQAQGIMASLEALEVAITLGHLNQNEATGQYLKIIEGTSFMHQAG